MTKEKTLLIMAAGMGSRFGGLKQIEPMGPNGEFIIDYSIYDAKLAGFTKVVFIIKEENYKIFKETIGKRVESHIKTEYVFQDNSCIPKKYLTKIKTRTKPLGTAYAILCAKNNIDGPFAVINADDFYGRDAYFKAAAYLDNIIYNHYGLVGYKVINTLSSHGVAKRGICETKDNKLTKITESKVVLKKNKVLAQALTSDKVIELKEDTTVSMNLLLFTSDIFKILEEELYFFLVKNQRDLSTVEFQIPDILDMCLKRNIKTIDIISTTATWHGVTYKEDKEEVKTALEKLTEEGVYEQPLWKN